MSWTNCQIIHSPEELQTWRNSQELIHRKIGFIPTMGALHAGHQQLLKKARQENDIVVLSIFVNPTQFNDPKDLANYPKTWQADLALAEKNQVDLIFAPTFAQMYPDDYKYKVRESEFSLELCGSKRPGHFDGVLTVVLKLFHLLRPTSAYFGEKDYQQLILIRDMVKAFFIPTDIIAVPTVRESDGLAMSSRNTRLSPSDREKAPLIYQIISKAASSENAINQLQKENFTVDYVKDLQGRRFVAAFLGDVRLIDNVAI